MNAHARDLPIRIALDDQRGLRDAFGRFATGVTVITCASELGPLAITANSFSSISLEPALVMWAVGTSSRRYPAFAAAEHFAIHVLGAEQGGLCQTMSKDGFALRRWPHELDDNGVPVIPGCLARFTCTHHAVYPAGDHAIILGKVVSAEMRSGPALAFFGGKFTDLAQP